MDEALASLNYTPFTTDYPTTLGFLLNNSINGSAEEVGDDSGVIELNGVKKEMGWGDYGLIMFYCSIIAGTVIGNTLVIAAVATTRRLRTVTNCFVMSLAVADWLVGMFVMPLKVVYHISRNIWTLGWMVCKIWIALDVMLCTSSILSLCIISIDRYLAITRPLAYSRRTRSKRLALAMISCVWVGSVAITTPPMFGWLRSEQKPEQRPGTCEYEDDALYVVYSAMGSFFVPLLVMLYVYARIACVIARRQTSIQKAHKSKDKAELADETGLTVNRTLSDIKEGGKHDKNVTHVTPSMSLFRVGQNGSGAKATSIWNPLLCFRCQEAKAKAAEGTPGNKRLVGDIQGTSPNEIPSPSTLLSIGLRPTAQHSTANQDNVFGHISGPASPGHIHQNAAGLRFTSRTGSRLCNHNLTNSSPPISISHRNKMLPTSSSSARLAGFTQQEAESLLPSRIWTVDDRSNDNVEQIRLTRSAHALNNGNCRNCFEQRTNQETNLGNNSVQTLENRRTPVPVHEYATSPPLASFRRHAGKVQSQSCSQISGMSKKWTCAPSQVLRSKSVRASVSHQLSDTQTPASKEVRYTSGRVSSFKRETKTAQTLAAVVGGFIICWLPFFVAYVIGPFVEPDAVSQTCMEFFVWLGWGNSAINPAIYAFYNPDFRSAFWRLTIHKCSGLFRLHGRSRDRSGSARRYDVRENQPPQHPSSA